MKNFLLFSLFVVTSMFGNTKIDSNSSPNTSSTTSNPEISASCISCTKIVASQCGITLPAVSTPVWASPVTSATNYRFEITKGSSVIVYESTNRYFLISQLGAGIPAYNTTYSIRVAAKVGGIWDDYGVSCNVSTPATPSTTKVVDSQCGSTVATVATAVWVNEIYLASAYRFEVSSGTNVIGTVDNSYRYFSLSQLSGIAYSSTYSVRVAVKFNGEWQPYGTSCNVNTPSSITETKLAVSFCGVTVPTATTQISANEVYLATSYRFEVTNGSTVRIIENPNRNFSLSQLSGGATYNTTYSIRVAVKFDGVWQLYGQSCNVTLPPLTKLVPSQCGVTLPAVSTAIWATVVPSASAYRFQVTKGSTVRVYETSLRYFSISLLPSIASYNTTYSVKASYRYNGVWLPYGDACSVTTPATVTKTRIVASQCGATLVRVSTPIWVNEVYLASTYRFEVSNGVNVVGTIDSPNRYFLLSQLTGITYNTTYSVRVAVNFNNVWQDYGSSCNVTTPSNVSTTKVVDSQCGSTLATINTPIWVNEIYLASDYRFEVTNGTTVRTYETKLRYFLLSQLSGGGLSNTTYSVRAAVKFDGVWQAYGPACTVKTPIGSISRMSNSNELQANVFAVKAFPNPFVSHFNLSIESSSDELVEVKVYDMIGRQLESRKATVTELTSKEIGVDYPAGVYNVIISQGNQLKTLRMIKR